MTRPDIGPQEGGQLLADGKGVKCEVFLGTLAVTDAHQIMAITELQLNRAVDLDAAWDIALASKLDRQACEEIRDSWDVAQIWMDWFSDQFGEIMSVRHRSPPDDPPDIDLVFADRVVACEHTRLQPRPLGWAEGLRREIDPGACTTVPSISNPPADRDAMLNTMIGIGDAWSDVIDDLGVIRNSLIDSVRKKMSGLPNGGIIVVVNHVQVADHDTLARVVADVLASEVSNFGPYTLILHERWNPLQFRSALFRKGESVRERKSTI